jgi:four helix bundle protein
MHTYSFEKLGAWQQARLLVIKIYNLTRNYPQEEKFGIVNQMRRAAISVCSNLAEGSSRKTVKDQALFYNISFSSLMELLNQLIISVDLGWLQNEPFQEIRSEIENVAYKINALRNSRFS